MLALMLAKFVLNDMPHAAGTHVNTAVAAFTPAYNISGGMHTWEELASITPRSAHHAILYSEVLRRVERRDIPPLGQLRWEYVQVPVGAIDGFVRTLAKYVKFSSSDIERLAHTFPLGDYFELSGEAEYYRPRWPNLTVLERAEMTEAFTHCLLRNTDQAGHIWIEMKDAGVYWPPILLGGEAIDGAHRLAALRGHYGPGYRIWVWRARL